MVDTRLPGKGNSNSHGARTVHQKPRWIRTSRLSIKNSLSGRSGRLSRESQKWKARERERVSIKTHGKICIEGRIHGVPGVFAFQCRGPLAWLLPPILLARVWLCYRRTWHVRSRDPIKTIVGCSLRGYLADKKLHSPRGLQQAYA